MSERLQLPVLGIPEYWLALDRGYYGDHAGIGETSLLGYLHPELVNIKRIRFDPEYGNTDDIEKGSSPELGKIYADAITDRLAHLAQAMVSWCDTSLDGFISAERAIISAQIKGWRTTKNAWAAWEKISRGEIVEYGQLLVE